MKIQISSFRTQDLLIYKTSYERVLLAKILFNAGYDRQMNFYNVFIACNFKESRLKPILKKLHNMGLIW